MMWKIAKHDGRDLAFAIDCWFASAITIDEFKLWLDEVIRSMPLEDIPGYIFDIYELEEALTPVDNIIGMVLSSGMTKLQEDALVGIADLRGAYMYDRYISKKRALRALQICPEIYDRFRHFFPFVELPDMPAADTD